VIAIVLALVGLAMAIYLIVVGPARLEKGTREDPLTTSLENNGIIKQQRRLTVGETVAKRDGLPPAIAVVEALAASAAEQ
jgi:hypothetical protein